MSPSSVHRPTSSTSPGFDAHLSERLNLLVIPATGKPSLVVPTLEAPLVGSRGRLVDDSRLGRS